MDQVLASSSKTNTINASHKAEVMSLTDVPAGLLIIKGPLGCGKTVTQIEIIELRMRAGDRVVGSSGANSAVNNLLHRSLKMQKDFDERLNIRMFSPSLETRCIESYIVGAPEDTDPIGLGHKQLSKLQYDLEYSMAGYVLKLAGVMPTTNKFILKMREQSPKKYSNLERILRIGKRSQTSKDSEIHHNHKIPSAVQDPIYNTRSHLQSKIPSTVQDLIDNSVGIFMTLTQGGSK